MQPHSKNTNATGATAMQPESKPRFNLPRTATRMQTTGVFLEAHSSPSLMLAASSPVAFLLRSGTLLFFHRFNGHYLARKLGDSMRYASGRVCGPVGSTSL